MSGARCALAYAQLMPLPLTVSCFSKIQIGFTFLVPAHPGSPGKRAVKRVCVCVCAIWNMIKARFLENHKMLQSEFFYTVLNAASESYGHAGLTRFFLLHGCLDM